MLTSITDFPTELQLEILDKLPARSLLNILCANSYWNSMVLSTVTSNINNMALKENIVVSVYSPQVYCRLVQTFNTVCISNPVSQINTPKEDNNQKSIIDLDQVSSRLESLRKTPHPLLLQSLHQEIHLVTESPYKTMFCLGTLESTHNPLNVLGVQEKPETKVHEGDNLRLLVNEDEPFIKLHIDMKTKNGNSVKSIFKFSTQLAPETSTGTVHSTDNILSLDYKLTRGDEVPPRFPYDYDVFYNYHLEVDNMQINSFYLLDRMTE